MNEAVATAGAVLFDLDGTLVDSEEITFACYRDALVGLGVVLDRATFKKYWSLGAKDAVVGFAGRDLTDDEFAVVHARKKKLFYERADLLVTELPAGALARLLFAANMPIAVVTAASRDTARAALSATSLDAIFSVVVCGDEVAATKPAPDGYLRAAQLLGVDPANCLAVEDSAVGEQSARNAGMQVLVVGRSHE